jgi:uncharacterized membrane protein YeaQ/YmgE (transglycosylase-associated protein family)
MLVLAGLVAGWVGEAASRAGGSGFVLDMVLGLIGSVVGGAIVWILISSDVSMRMRGRSPDDRRSAAAVALRDGVSITR